MRQMDRRAGRRRQWKRQAGTHAGRTVSQSGRHRYLQAGRRAHILVVQGVGTGRQAGRSLVRPLSDRQTARPAFGTARGRQSARQADRQAERGRRTVDNEVSINWRVRIMAAPSSTS